MLTKVKSELANDLYRIGAIKFGAFRLKLHEKYPDAPLSPIYIDLRIIRSFPEVMRKVIRSYRKLLKGLDFNLIADVPTAATPIVAILSYTNRIPMISPRVDRKLRGTGALVDGIYEKKQIVLLVDDIITHAESKLEAINTLEDNGLIVRDVIVLINREQGGEEELNKYGYSCHSAFIISELLDHYYNSKFISSSEYLQTKNYISNSDFYLKLPH